MNLFDPWNAFFFVAWLVYFWTRHVFMKRTEGEKKVVSYKDGLEHGLLLAMLPGVMALPLIYLLTPLLSFANYELPVAALCSGVVLVLVSLWLFYRSHADLGQNWSVSLEIREKHELVIHGVYKHIRHPMYASIWLWAIGQGLVLQNWLAGWAVVPAFALMYFLRLPREEALMIEKFGDEYREYMKRTGRLFPRLGATSPPDAKPS